MISDAAAEMFAEEEVVDALPKRTLDPEETYEFVDGPDCDFYHDYIWCESEMRDDAPRPALPLGSAQARHITAFAVEQGVTIRAFLFDEGRSVWLAYPKCGAQNADGLYLKSYLEATRPLLQYLGRGKRGYE